jgi:Zn-dependent peptidase ImmA (M78 family)
MGVSLEGALPYGKLADEFGVVVWTPGDVPGLDDATVRQLLVTDAGSWSAVTVHLDSRHVVVVNTAQDKRRIPNNVVHELAHVILGHAAARVDISEDGHLWLSTYGSDQEKEADWLAASLLLPREGLLSCFSRCRDIEATAAQFQVSLELVRWRLNATGVWRQVNGHAR